MKEFRQCPPLSTDVKSNAGILVLLNLKIFNPGEDALLKMKITSFGNYECNIYEKYSEKSNISYPLIRTPIL